MLKRTVGPPVYVRGCDVLALAGEYTAPLGKRVLIAGGKTALSVSKTILLSSMEKANLDVVGVEWYGAMQLGKYPGAKLQSPNTNG